MVGSRYNWLVLVRNSELADENRYTVKRYRSEKAYSEEGFAHTRIRAQSRTEHPSWDLDMDESKYEIVAEFVRGCRPRVTTAKPRRSIEKPEEEPVKTTCYPEATQSSAEVPNLDDHWACGETQGCSCYASIIRNEMIVIANLIDTLDKGRAAKGHQCSGNAVKRERHLLHYSFC